MKGLENLSEARIREWQAKQREVAQKSGRATAEPVELDEPLEVTLMKKLQRLKAEAQAAEGEARSALEKRARDVELQLLVLLERTGRALTARRMADR